MTQANVQLGKNGITENFISTLKHHFDRHSDVKISVLRSATRDKQQLKKYMDEILEKLGKNYTARTLGFSIFVKKWRREVR